ncbi:GNAT family N-acetyltransferase [Cellulomonas sp. ICMP 17802]|uniref:GNAT family N-acetyltransferase n=1 Tax=Cellulomonas sp. ICMP 17802 TaxID=3239199 RepID=UPI00351BBF07
MTPTELETGAHLDALEPWRAAEFAAHMDRAREHIRPWVGPSFLSDDVAGAHATLTRYAEHLAHDGPRIYGIWADGTLVGGVMFVEFHAAAGVCEVGCWSEPAGEGHGHITAAVTELLRYAFEVRGMHRVEWRCRSDNLRSIAVARRLGMVHEGDLREAWLVDGTFHDKAVWSLLSHEFDGRDRTSSG